MRLLILGCGYVGKCLGAAMARQGAKVYGTTRSKDEVKTLSALGIEPVLISSVPDIGSLLSERELKEISHLVDSIPLVKGDHHYAPPQARFFGDLLPFFPRLAWAGYLSTTAVYGDTRGHWVDESSPTLPGTDRGVARLLAEDGWQNYFSAAEIFRLPGIYGPGRNLLPRLLAEDYKVVRWEPPRYSNRIHVDDIVSVLMAAMEAPSPGRIVNLADDFPCSHADYVEELCRAVKAPPPRWLTPEEAEKELSPTVLEFFKENKRVSNKKLHRELLPDLRYPTFREALPELLREIGLLEGPGIWINKSFS